MPPDPSPAAADGYTKVLQGRYELGRVLGRGGSSKVYRARDIRTGVPVAVKAIRKVRHPCSPEEAAAVRRSVEREVAALRRVQGNPHVARLLDVLASRSTVYLVLELARGGSLLSALDGGGRREEPAARRLFAQLASALAHAHACGVFHRDVKTENLLLDERGDLKLTDFGLCAFADRHLAATLCGSPAYVAPEILLRKRYDAGKADVWSAGVVLFVLAAGYLPFNDGNLMAMYRKICAGSFRFPKWCSPELRHLISCMLDPDPDTRIGMDQVMEHPWLRQDCDGDGDTSPPLAMTGAAAGEVAKWEAEVELGRELNAFDIIAAASGCDLSGLVGPLPERVRLLVAGADARCVLDKAEELGRREGYAARRKEKEDARCGGLVFQGAHGELIAQVRVDRLSQHALLVEAKRAGAGEAPTFWDKLQLGLRSLQLSHGS